MEANTLGWQKILQKQARISGYFIMNMKNDADLVDKIFVVPCWDRTLLSRNWSWARRSSSGSSCWFFGASGCDSFWR